MRYALGVIEPRELPGLLVDLEVILGEWGAGRTELLPGDGLEQARVHTGKASWGLRLATVTSQLNRATTINKGCRGGGKSRQTRDEECEHCDTEFDLLFLKHLEFGEQFASVV